MKKHARFEVCGLHYVLQKSGSSLPGKTQFALCDEAFSCRPIRFSAESYEEFFEVTEAFIGLELPAEKRDELRSELGSFRRQKPKVDAATHAFDRPTSRKLLQHPVGLAVGM